MKIIIPARLGSKGLPFKNRKLFHSTASSIPSHLSNEVWVTTDDLEIVKLARQYNFNVLIRPDHLAKDETSIKDVLLHALTSIDAKDDETVCVLYLTYPQRTWEDISKAHQWYIENSNELPLYSMLCKQEVKSNPFLCLFDEDGHFGSQVINHDLYRRQDYPPTFELSHYIAFFKSGNLPELNNNIYNRYTLFYPIDRVIDVDTQNDLNKL
jgi:CMP-N-acetylneuraminic acid synthetase